MIAGVEWPLVRVYFLELPLATGRARGGDVDSTASSLAFLGITFVVLVAGPSLIARRVRDGGARLAPGVALPLALSAALLLTCAAFVSLTKNEPSEGVPLFFASVGLFHVAVALALPAWRMFGSTRLAVPVGIGIATIAVATAWTFNSHVNGPREANNVDFEESKVEPRVPAGLSFMRFQVPTRYEGLRAEDGRGPSSRISARSRGIFVPVGDTTILNGLAGKPSVFPALYLTGGLTIPEPGTPELAEFEQRLFRRIGQADVRRVVLERLTWEGVSLSDLPRFRSFVDRCEITSRTIGFFKVIELASQPGCRRPA